MADASNSPTRGPIPSLSGTWVIDLDGVIWLADEPIAGSAQAVNRLRAAGHGVLFATNNSSPTVAQLMQRLARAGIDATADDVVSSAQAAAAMVEPGTHVMACGEDGLTEALTLRGLRVVEDGLCDVVFIGWTRRFDFDMLASAASAIRAGARFIGTNEDATYPTPNGLLPGCGSLVAAVATAAQCEPEIAGKPHAPMADLIAARTTAIALMVGDRPSTDGALARRLGVPYGLVRSGVTAGGREPMVVEPDFDALDLAALVDQQLDS